MKNNKKGFTLLEMVVVIAVFIVIMVATIMTFTNLIHKAKLNADATFVKTVNELIDKSSETVDSFEDAMLLIKDNGYNEHSFLAKLKSDHIIYDTQNNKFLLINDNGKVIYSETEADECDYLVVVVDQGDLKVEGNHYLFTDVEVSNDLRINGGYTIDLNGKTITTEKAIILTDDGCGETTIKNGNIKARELKFEDDDLTVNLDKDCVITLTNFVTSSNVKMKENATLVVASEMKVNDNVQFMVSGNHTLDMPSRITIGKNVKAASSLDFGAFTVEDEVSFAKLVARTDRMNIASVEDFEADEDSYYLSSGIYFLSQDIELDKPLKIKADNYVTISFRACSLTFTSEKDIVNNGVLKIYGESTSITAATIKGGKYGVYNNGSVSINNVNIVTGTLESSALFNEDKTYGIYNNGQAATLEINKSTIKANCGVYSRTGTTYINSATIECEEYSFQGAGYVRIGAKNDSTVSFTAKLTIMNLTRDVEIGVLGGDNRGIYIPANLIEVKGDTRGFTNHTR
ncbi:MAG: prepilin-type N-terminal cleavage/methylation domain-containing protein [Clostridia bacterium]|nr:prepilin-type N-terminal cleavage/methylation domain-containing protein [Clostridia bacterium]